MLCYMSNGFIGAVHDADSENIVEKFLIEVILSGRYSRDDLRCAIIQPELHRYKSAGSSVISEALAELRQEFRSDVPVHKQDFLRVTYGWAAGLCILNYTQGLFLIS